MRAADLKFTCRSLSALFLCTLLAANPGGARGQSTLDEAIAAFREKDYGFAFPIFLRAAKSGEVTAQFYLGLAYQKGWGAVADKPKARQWYEEAARQGSNKARVNLAQMLLRNPLDEQSAAQAISLLSSAVAAGDLKATHELGLAWYHGATGKRDFDKARTLWLTAAKAGVAKSAYNLGIIYRRGLGVRRDLNECLRWWRSAAEGGLGAAQNSLGTAYLRGEGVTADLVEAFAWFVLARDGGLNVAVQNLEMVREQLSPEQRARAHSRVIELRQRHLGL
ncbi:MAG: tetratricopeptide repeat protein [Pseudomonadota bacterium]